MRWLDVDELVIYCGVGTLALGAGLAFGNGIGLMILGLGVIGVGLLRVLAPEPPPAKPESRRTSADFDAMLTASPEELDE